MKGDSPEQYASATADMLEIHKSQFVMGSDAHYPEEKPAHRVDVEAFLIDLFAVSNRQFASFVRETRYQTTAERGIDPEQCPNMPADFYRPAGMVFRMTNGPVPLNNPSHWWHIVEGASWRHPEGPSSSIDGREDHPVVQVSYFDALAYAKWAGKNLPTEEQWESAAQGDLENSDNTINIWAGSFPHRNLNTNKPPFTVSVYSPSATPSRAHHLLGNVWEWTHGIYSAQHEVKSSCCIAPAESTPFDKRVLKGGSFLCADSYCRRYRPPARIGFEMFSSSNHIGFRCVQNP